MQSREPFAIVARHVCAPETDFIPKIYIVDNSKKEQGGFAALVDRLNKDCEYFNRYRSWREQIERGLREVANAIVLCVDVQVKTNRRVASFKCD